LSADEKLINGHYRHPFADNKHTAASSLYATTLQQKIPKDGNHRRPLADNTHPAAGDFYAYTRPLMKH